MRERHARMMVHIGSIEDRNERIEVARAWWDSLNESEKEEIRQSLLLLVKQWAEMRDMLVEAFKEIIKTIKPAIECAIESYPHVVYGSVSNSITNNGLSNSITNVGGAYTHNMIINNRRVS